MSQRILFIHGLASSGRFKMADQLRILIKGAEVLAPDVPPEPETALAFLEAACRDFRPGLIVGHSLGGFLARWLKGIPKALVNPTFSASPLLRFNMGEMKYLSPRADGAQSFMVTEELCRGFEELESVQFGMLTQEEKDLTTAFFADNDEIVRHRHIFEREYGKPGIRYPGTHNPAYPEMKQYIVPVLKEILI
ncbi:MAG: alpha/beta fold hydrolase [Bacteroidales bacterium]|nr:alpha/beta fold hydrolase [Bacteroidales bacterium]